MGYYEMCDKVVEALKDHPTLLEKHFTFLNDKHYKDESLHLLAFDVIYCSKAYKFYLGMHYQSKKESIKAYTEAQIREKERLEKETRISSLENEILDLELKADQYAPISLLNVEVNHYKYGKGIVVSQEINKIVVKFNNNEATLFVHKMYSKFFTLEGGDEIINAMSEYADINARLKKLRDDLKHLI